MAFNYQLLLERDDKFKTLIKNVRKDNKNYGFSLPKKLPNNEYVISLIDTQKNIIASFIWFGIYSNDKINNFERYIHINFSYTFEIYRNCGLNKKLRLWIESFSIENNINCIVSVPLPDSNSLIILHKLGYSKNENYYIKKIS